MSYLNVIMPLSEFYPYITKELEKYNIEFCIDYFDSANKIQMEKISSNNFKDQLSKYYDKNLRFYFLDRAQNINKNQIYKDAYCIYAIAGEGGRETNEAVELIHLRIISKIPDQNIKRFFNALKRKLNHDQNIGKGVQGDSKYYDQFFYVKSLVGIKVFKSDFYNSCLPVLNVK